ncbi:MAG: hypothetical protein M3340_01455 [Actinomycetota bacterium]|nr:hypothetical protein [Actinomycetota bacterium]
MADEKAPKGKVYLIASEESEPDVESARGRRFEVSAVSIVGPDLRQVEGGDMLRPRPMKPPRLCGSRSTCVAIVEMPDEGQLE